MTVVADASPLIALAQVGQLPLLEGLFGEVVAPPAVMREVGLSLPGFIRERKLSQPIPAAVLRASLDPGEGEAISLAIELDADRVILDERAARQLALSLGLAIIGVLGILLASKQKGLVSAVRPHPRCSCREPLPNHARSLRMAPHRDGGDQAPALGFTVLQPQLLRRRGVQRGGRGVPCVGW